MAYTRLLRHVAQARVRFPCPNLFLPVTCLFNQETAFVGARNTDYLFFFFQAEDGIRDDLVTGVQTCALPICERAAHVAGIGLIIGSQRNVSCTFTPSLPGPIEYYTGTISKLGVDLGVTAGGGMVWLVFSPTNRPGGGLAGPYVGRAAGAPVVARVGANALGGGSSRCVALQRLSVSGEVGLNIAAGVAGLDLRFVR